MIELIIGILIGAISTTLLVYAYVLNRLSDKELIKNHTISIWKSSKDWEY